MTEEEETIKANLELFPFEGDISLRNVAFGMTPNILIEGDSDEDGNIVFNITATADAQEDLVGVLTLVLSLLENGEEAE